MPLPPAPSPYSRSARRAAVAAAAVVFASFLSAFPAVAASPSAASVVATPRPSTPHQVLVRFRATAGRAGRDAALRRVGGVRIGSVYGARTTIVRIPAGTSPRGAAALLRTTPGVAWARPDGVARIAAPLPDDPQFQQQYGFRNTGQAGGLVDADVDAPEGWEAAGLSPTWPASGGVKIGFVDTGLDKTHPEFSGRVTGCVHTETGAIVDGCKDGNGHGTHVVGIAAASTDNGTGVAGVSFDSPIYSCRALGANGFGNDSDVAACINWLVDRGVKVINMSLTVDDPSTIQASVVDAWNGGAGALLVAAAGNTGTTTPQYPAAFAGVVSVGNTNSADVINAGSSHNPDVELSAPGTSIYSTYKSATYATLTGTSMASPIVAGVAAITWWLHPAETAQQIRNRLHGAVDDLGAVGRDPYYGFGRINLCLAAGGSCTYAPSPPSAGAIAGTVKNSGGQPLKARVVVLTGPTLASTRSNAATGAYTLSGLTPGAYSVKAKRKGCAALTKPVTVSANATAMLNFALTCA